ncbi:MAG: hypothetical protein ACJ762_01440 [Solirubrobacteraceae bacterium]
MILPALAAAAVAATNVGVAEREWRIGVYVPVVKRGLVTFNVHNFGEDAHDLRLRGPQRFRSPVMPEVQPGQNATLTVRLSRRGRYALVCTLPGHEKLGMRAVLRVR